MNFKSSREQELNHTRTVAKNRKPHPVGMKVLRADKASFKPWREVTAGDNFRFGICVFEFG